MELIIQWVFIIGIAWFVLNRFIPVKGVSNISALEAKKKFRDKDVQFVDVRTPGEYKVNHRKPFKNIPLSQLPQQCKELDKNKEVVVICQSGMRSMKASKILRKQGFEKVTNVKGGMNGWI